MFRARSLDLPVFILGRAKGKGGAEDFAQEHGLAKRMRGRKAKARNSSLAALLGAAGVGHRFDVSEMFVDAVVQAFTRSF